MNGLRIFLSLLWLSLMLISQPLMAKKRSEPSGQRLYVQSVSILGAKRTKHWVIYNEMTFQKGDSVTALGLDLNLRRNQLNIYNLGLFNKVEIQHEVLDQRLYVFITVTERWYLFGTPILKIEERNTYDLVEALSKLNFHRLSFGGEVDWRNISGRNETLSLYGQLGFSQRLRVSFLRPALIKKKNIDFLAVFDYTNQKEIIYGTENGEARWGRQPAKFLQRSWFGSIGMRKRFSVYQSVYWELSYAHYTFDDTIYQLPLGAETAEYLTNDQGREFYPSVVVHYVNDRRDIRSFPLSGYKYQIFLRAVGLIPVGTTSFFKLGGTWAHHIPLSRRWNFAYGTHNVVTLGGEVPYFEKSFIGIRAHDVGGLSSNLRGYEPYAVDATFITMNKAEVKFAILPRRIVEMPWVPFKRFRQMPLGIYLSAFCDTGYLQDWSFNNQDSFLKGQLLYGYGLGLNIIGIYDRLLRVEVSRNHLGQTGIYLNGTVPIK